MKNSFRRQKAFVFFLLAVLFALSLNFQIRAQDKKAFELKEIIGKLQENSGAENQQKIIEEVCKRGVIIKPDAGIENSLRNAGAGKDLTEAINQESQKFEFSEKFYELFICSYSDCGGIARRKLQVKAAKDYLEKFENNRCSKNDPLIPYFKENLPIIERTIEEAEKRQKESAKEKKENANFQNLNVKDDKKSLKIKEIIEKLKKDSDAENQQNIIKEICERGTDENLNAKYEKLLRDAGADDSIIKAIREKIEREKEGKRVYNLYVSNYQGPDVEKLKRAVKAVRDYLEKLENSECAEYDPLIPYFKENLPILEQQIKEIEDRKKPDIDYFPRPKWSEYAEKFNDAVKRKDWKTAFYNGDEILKLKPKFLDLALVLAAIGYQRAVESDKREFDEKTISYAELAIKMIDEGETSENYGVNFDKDRKQDYTHKTKSNALGWMNYIVGYIKYFRQNKKTQAVTSLYKAANYKSEVQNFPELYRAVGDWYFEQVAEVKKSEKPNDTTVKNLLELALDAYARAYNLSKTDAKRELSEKILVTYALRHSRQPTAAEIEKITNAVKEKPLPEPF